jgi:hypothetical protein
MPAGAATAGPIKPIRGVFKVKSGVTTGGLWDQQSPGQDMLGMFSLQGKMRGAIGEERSRDYEAVYRRLAQDQADGRLPMHEDYLGGNELAISVYSRKYYVKDLEGRPWNTGPRMSSAGWPPSWPPSSPAAPR